MLRGMIGTGVCIAALMAGVKDGRLMHATGLAGSCTVVEQLRDGSVIDGCRAGALMGRPDLSRRNCRETGVRGAIEYWRCPEGTQAP